MRTLGIDLSAQDKKTAFCLIEWGEQAAHVQPPVVGSEETSVLEQMRQADWIGIDAPFGWPDAMVHAVHAYSDGRPWPMDLESEDFRLRLTDHVVHRVVAEDGPSIWPLSVSSDRIAICAVRCARLLSAYAVAEGWALDRVGKGISGSVAVAGGVVEIYPAAGLARWDLPHKGYKSASSSTASVARSVRANMMDMLEQRVKWIDFTSDAREVCIENDDAFDAFVSSLLTRAAGTGRTASPTREQIVLARREGWIHLPAAGSLETLNLDQ